jgi:hypothetical protein
VSFLNAINLRKLAVLGVLVVVPHYAMCQEAAETEDHSIVLQVGPAVERNLSNKTSNSGSTIAVEFTPIEDVLEIEVGATSLNSAGQRELGGEVLFKKPYHLSSTTEIMIGVGPQIGRKYQGVDTGTSFGVAFALDLMFWPTKNIGWYLSPEYGYGVGKSNGERSIGASVGIEFGM